MFLIEEGSVQYLHEEMMKTKMIWLRGNIAR